MAASAEGLSLRLGHRGGLLVALLAGSALPLAFAPFAAWWVAPLSVAALWLSWEHCSSRSAFRRGFVYGSAAFLFGTYWTFISIHEFGKAPALLAGFLTLALVAIMGLYYGLMGALAARVDLRAGPAAWFLFLPGAWVVVEWLRGTLFSGFPWLSLGYSQSDSPLGGYAPVGGMFLISLAVALLGGCLAALLRGGRRVRVGALGLALAVLATGAWLKQVSWSEPGEAMSVALVQGAVPQEQKWLPSMLEPTRERYVRMTDEHLDARLVVWPEAAIPALRHEEAAFLEQASRELAEAETGLILGMVERDPDTGQYLNRLLALGAASGEYSKRHLVPFGEYFPVPAFVRQWLRLMNLPYTDFEAGAPDQEPLRLGDIALAPTICYEDAFGREQLVFLPEAGLLVNASNDAWFGDSIAAHQHLQIARLRAMETDRPMLRATNTGISAIIAHDGRVVEHSPQFEPHVLRAEVSPRSGATPYVRLGDALVLGLGALGMVAGLLLGRARRA